MTDDSQAQYRGRDSASLAIIGGFFVVLSLFVLCGNFVEAAKEFPAAARNVNLAAGTVLFFTGVFMGVVAKQINRRGETLGRESASPTPSSATSERPGGSGPSPTPPDGTDS